MSTNGPILQTEHHTTHSARAGSTFNKYDNGFYVTCTIGSSTINFLIDCGATTSLISEKTLKELGPARTFCLCPTSRTLKTINGDSMAVTGSVDLLVDMANQRFDLSFVVCSMEIDGILGQDFLREHVDSINYKRSCLVIGQNLVPLWTGGQANQICRVELQDTVKLPSHTRMMVPVKIPQKEHLTPQGFVEPSIELMAKSEVCIMGGIVDIAASNKIILNLMNYGQTDITLYKKTTLGTCESYFESENQPERIASISESEENGSFPDHLLDLLERSSTHLNENEKQSLSKLLYKYQGVFSKNSEDIGRTNIVQHSIDTKDAHPIRQPPRRLPLGKRQMEKDEIDKMLKRGIIEPSKSAWASPVVLVTKKDGTPRFCIDYRKLNDVTVKDAYPLPRVDDCIDALSGAKFFSSLDLNSGYWQVGMKEEDKEKTAFCTTMGLYHFSVMSFGLVNAPSTFERLMENVLRGLQWVECLLYMDEIIVPCTTVEEGLERLEHIFQRLHQACLKCKPSKCIFFQKQVKFLGHLVSEDGVAADPDKVKAVRDWPIPCNAKQVKSFLGLSSYYRRFVQGYAKIARPLHKVCEKGSKFDWSEDCNNAFNQLKDALTSAPILGYPMPNAKFILDTDASHFSTGAVLSQVQGDREVVIAYYSKSLNQHEKSYCVTRKELLAVVHALKAFHHYLYGQPVLLRTDNAAVSWMRNLKQPTGQVARWLEVLGTYDLIVTHRPGLQHRNADALSRLPCTKCAKQQSTNDEIELELDENSSFEPHKQIDNASTVDSTLPTTGDSNSHIARAVTRNQNSSFSFFNNASVVIPHWSPQDLRTQQLADSSINFIIQAKEASNIRPPWQEVASTNIATKVLWRMWDRLSLHDGCLFRTWYDDKEHSYHQLVVPVQRKQDVLHYMHDIPSSAHLGNDKMLEKIRQTFYWPGLTSDVDKFCSKCHMCAARKPSLPHKAPLGSISVIQPHEKCALDIFGPLPKTQQQNVYILVVCDCFTRWTEAIPLPNQLSETIAKAFVNEYVSRYGVPMQIHTDRGTNFTSKLIEDICELLQIHHTKSTPLHPQSNGIVERFNRSLKTMLSMYCNSNQRTWDVYLPQVMMAYRSSVHASTGQTPNRMVFGREVVLPLQAFTGLPAQSSTTDTPNTYVDNLQAQLEDIHEIARKVLKSKSQYRKRHYDLKAKKRVFNPGDPVWLHDTSRRKGVCNKLTPQWKGPYVITKRIDDLVYLVKHSQSTPAKAIHIDRLAMYKCSNTPEWFKSYKNTV